MMKLMLAGAVAGIVFLMIVVAVLLVKIYKGDKNGNEQNGMQMREERLPELVERKITFKALLAAFIVLMISGGLALVSVVFLRMRGSSLIKFLIFAGGGFLSELFFVFGLECNKNMHKKGISFFSFIFGMIGMVILMGMVFGLGYSLWKHRLWDFWYNIFSPMAGFASSLIFVSSYAVYKYVIKRGVKKYNRRNAK